MSAYDPNIDKDFWAFCAQVECYSPDAFPISEEAIASFESSYQPTREELAFVKSRLQPMVNDIITACTSNKNSEITYNIRNFQEYMENPSLTSEEYRAAARGKGVKEISSELESELDSLIDNRDDPEIKV